MVRSDTGMNKRILVVGVVAALALGGVIAVKQGYWAPVGAVAQAPKQTPPRVVPVDVAVAVKKKVPVRLDLLGTVTPIAGVAVKTRIDTEIVGVHFRDGSMVRTGDLLFTLDGRAIEAQVRQIEGQLARDKASLEGAERDLKRYTELVAKSATPVINLDNARTQVGVFSGAVKADEASIDNLKVQLSYCSIRAQIAGRVSMAAVKVGNFVRQADLTPLATIIQQSPIYVTFALPQRSLSDLRLALTDETATIEAIIPGDPRRATGQVTMIENTVDANTGTVPVRATMPNTDELLWPGTLVTVRLTFRDDVAVTIPNTAIQVSQSGSFVFVVKDGIANVQPVKVARVLDAEAVLESGLEGGETVVTEGQLQITNGARVSVRVPKAGS
jgi:multidrug efflux system membrane fusion protein